jgi:hypothetical protein
VPRSGKCHGFSLIGKISEAPSAQPKLEIKEACDTKEMHRGRCVPDGTLFLNWQQSSAVAPGFFDSKM